MTSFTLLITISGFLFLLFLYFWSTYNSFIKGKLQVQTDFSDIDIQLKRRSSLIQNLADMVKGYAKHEENTFTQVAKARSAVNSSQGAQDSAKADTMLTQTLRSLFAVVEAYPQLKANENFQNLQNELKQTEDLIARYREEYNLSVQAFNIKIQTFPNLFVSALFHFQPAQLFQSSTTPDNKVEI